MYFAAYLRNEDNDDKSQANPGSSYAEECLERKLVLGVAVMFPSSPETDVREADATPREQRCKARESNEPVEDDHSSGGQGHECKRRPR